MPTTYGQSLGVNGQLTTGTPTGTITSQVPAAGAMPNQGTPPAGFTAPNFSGSYQEWVERAVAALIARYTAGDQSMLDNMTGSTAGLGQPDGADFGSHKSGNGGYSPQTEAFFRNYVMKLGGSDPWMLSQFGPPPGQQATYQPDPNSPGSVAATQAASAANTAATQAASSAATTAATIQNAQLQALTERYINEGNWGVQRYVADSNNKAQMDRLLLQLGDNAKDRALRAQTEADQQHVAMLGLVNQVAQYDANLAAEPRNWIAYASWLKNRDVVVNGLNLAIAAQTVPPAAISPQEVAATSPGAAMQQAATQSQGGSMTTQPIDAQPTGTGLSATTPPPQQQPGATVNGVNLNGTDYSAIARQLLGEPGNGNPGGSAPTTADLQSAYDATRTPTDGSSQQSFGTMAGGDVRTNNLGMRVNANGAQQNYTDWQKLLPAQQDMQLSAVKSVNKWTPDFLQEMDKSRPKGGLGASIYASGNAAYG